MASENPRSRAALSRGFTDWFTASRPDWDAISVTVSRPQPGLSSDTVMLAVSHADGSEEYVGRLPPLGEGLFPDYDLARQHRVQTMIGAAGLPVAVPIALETDPAWTGAPFLLMPRVAGHTLTTSPPYLTTGWLAEQSPAMQRQVIIDVVRLLARLHRMPFDASDLAGLTGGGPDLDSILDYWERYLDWATDDDDAASIYRRGLAWCRERRPAPLPPSLLWGDPQLVNVVFDDTGTIAAALDWEMAGPGPAEMDLAWFLTLHEHAIETAGVSLPGDPGREAIIDTYAEALGRPVRDLGWFEALANIRSGAIVLRIGTLLQRAGHSPAWTTQVPQPRHLAELIGA
jgi:aminoglycoside phosphotransferase (APT) family kinase protein